MIDFILRADTHEAFETLAKANGFMNDKGNPTFYCIFDPTPRTQEWETGIQIEHGPPGLHINVRVWGALEKAQTAGLTQTKESDVGGRRTIALPLRERTKLGREMTAGGEEHTQSNRYTSYVYKDGVAFIDPETIKTRQRTWL